MSRVDRINPYSMDKPRQVDFITPLGLQVKSGAGSLELWQCVATTTLKAGVSRPLDPIKAGDHGILKRDPIDRDKMTYIQNESFENDDADPRNSRDREIKTQSEILEDIVNAHSVHYDGDFPDIVIQARAAYMDVGKMMPSVSNLPALDGADGYLFIQDASGNFAHVFSKMLNLRLADPYYFTRAELWDNGIIPEGKKNHPVLRKMRSVLQTRNSCTNISSWGSLDLASLRDIEREVMKGTWHQDLAHPVKLGWTGNAIVGQGQVYHLERRDKEIALRSYL